MFAKLVVLAATFGGLVSAWTTVSASPPAPTVTTVSQCNTGAASCCNSFGSASTLPGVNTALSLAQVVLADPSINVGLGCSLLNVGGTCTQQPVCCTDNDFRSVITIACNSVTL